MEDSELEVVELPCAEVLGVDRVLDDERLLDDDKVLNAKVVKGVRLLEELVVVRVDIIGVVVDGVVVVSDDDTVEDDTSPDDVEFELALVEELCNVLEDDAFVGARLEVENEEEVLVERGTLEFDTDVVVSACVEVLVGVIRELEFEVENAWK